MKTKVGINQVCDIVAESLTERGDYSPTTIRCAINDTLDSLSKDGYAVNFDYNQPRAIRVVRQLLGLCEVENAE